MDMPIEARETAPRRQPRLVADRLISDLRFGAEWTPKLVDVMREHPHDDSEFMTTETAPEAVEAAKDIWRRRVAELPTDAALRAWDDVHAEKRERMMALLRRCGVEKAEDIETLGCTGAHTNGLTLDEIKFLRIGLAGSGVGLPCFVPPDRYCLAHDVSGGLQDEQEQHYAAAVPAISRDLTPAERAHANLVQEARQNEEGSTAARRVLRGRKLPDGWEKGENAEKVERTDTFLGNVDAPAEFHDVLGEPPGLQWRCTHTKLNWSCRYCVAQAIVEGDLVPAFALDYESGPATVDMAPDELEQAIEAADANGVDGLMVYVRVATYSRKLSRD